MSRSNYNTKLLNAIWQDYSTQPYNSFVAPSNTSTPDPGSSTWGLYRISTAFDSDSTESAIALSPLQSIYVTPAAPTKEFPVTAKLTATFSITWSIDRPDLIELIILAGNVAFVRRLVPDYGTTPCGNRTVSGTV